MRTCGRLLKSHGCVTVRDTAHARLLTLSRPDALNAMTLPMLRDLYEHHVESPHPEKDAIYVMRGNGLRSFCAGGDIRALTQSSGEEYTKPFFVTEYLVDYHMGSMKNTQVPLWSGHVLGSGVGASLHSRYRVGSETVRLGMPETQIGAIPDVGASYVFAKLPVRGLGAYLLITGDTLHGADVFHAGLATHYVPTDRFDQLEKSLLSLHKAADVKACLDDFHTSPPPFTLAAHTATLERAFGNIQADTTVRSIMNALQEDGSPFALSVLATMQRNGPSGMSVALENYKRQGSGACTSLLDAMRFDYEAIQCEPLRHDFRVGVVALFSGEKGTLPAWRPAALEDVDVATLTKSIEEAAKNSILDPFKSLKDYGC